MQTENSNYVHSDVSVLNSFLRGELAAVEAYRVALDNLDHTSEARSQLEICRLSHQDRVDLLRQTIAEQGGQPAYSSGPWGTLTSAVESAAGIFGAAVAISALAQGEEHGLRDYRGDLKKLAPRTRQFVTSKLLPAQEETQRAVTALKEKVIS